MKSFSRKPRAKLLGVCLVALALSACDGDGSVGELDCVGARIRCERPKTANEIWLDSDVIVSTLNLPELAPTSVRELPVPVHPVFTAIATALITDADDTIWFFAVQPEGVVVMTLDESGEVLERDLVAPLDEVSDLAPDTLVMSVQRSGRRPVLNVYWPPSALSTSSKKLSEARNELIAFRESPAEAPRRIELDLSAPDPWGRVTLNDDGSALVVTRSQSVELYDPKLDLLWRQTALRGSAEQSHAAARLEDGRLVVAELASYGPGGTRVYLLDADGSPSAASTVVPALSAHSMSLFQSTAGGALLAADTSQGDLVALRVRGEALGISAVTMRREEFTELGPYALAVDRSGSMYLLSRAGGRDPEDERRILCRAPVDAEASCVTLVAPPDLEERHLDNAMFAAKDNGTVLMAVDGHLVRYDFPAP